MNWNPLIILLAFLFCASLLFVGCNLSDPSPTFEGEFDVQEDGEIEEDEKEGFLLEGRIKPGASTHLSNSFMLQGGIEGEMNTKQVRSGNYVLQGKALPSSTETE